MEATKRPWEVNNQSGPCGRSEIFAHDCLVCDTKSGTAGNADDGTDEANAELIVRAVNSFEDCIKALEASRKFIEAMMDFYGKNLEVANWHMNGALEPLDTFIDDNSTGEELKLIDAALSKATNPQGEL